MLCTLVLSASKILSRFQQVFSFAFASSHRCSFYTNIKRFSVRSVSTLCLSESECKSSLRSKNLLGQRDAPVFSL